MWRSHRYLAVAALWGATFGCAPSEAARDADIDAVGLVDDGTSSADVDPTRVQDARDAFEGAALDAASADDGSSADSGVVPDGSDRDSAVPSCVGARPVADVECMMWDCAGGAWALVPDDDAPCDDGLACGVGDRCVDGACVSEPIDCDDRVDCTVDSCNEETGHCVSDATGCD